MLLRTEAVSAFLVSFVVVFWLCHVGRDNSFSATPTVKRITIETPCPRWTPARRLLQINSSAAVCERSSTTQSIVGPPLRSKVTIKGMIRSRLSAFSCFPSSLHTCGVLVWLRKPGRSKIESIVSSLNRHEWGADFPVTAVAGAPVIVGGVTTIVQANATIFSVLSASPYERTLFLTDDSWPSDGAVSAPPTLLLARLDHFDAIMTPISHWDSASVQRAVRLRLNEGDYLTEALHHPGLIAFRRGKRWSDFVEEWRRASLDNDCSVGTVPHVCSLLRAARRSIARLRAAAPYHCIDRSSDFDRCRCPSCSSSLLSKMTQCGFSS